MKNVMLVLGALALLSVFGVDAAMAQSASDHGAQVGGTRIITGAAGIAVGAGIGTGLIVMGAAAGIGRIASSAVESIARQPEAGGRIFTSMLLAAALIEGFTFFAVFVTFSMGGKIAEAVGG